MSAGPAQALSPGMRTLIISDLHLGSVSGSDLLRREELRAPLMRAVADVQRVVLLGDVLELRHGPPREALAAARPFFEELGRALCGGELIIIAGNHDHALIEPWLAQRGEEAAPAPLHSEQLLAPAQASPLLGRLAEWAAPARVHAAYPGVWLRPDVYATHGHYLDCHLTVPTLERLSVGLMSRLLGRPASSLRSVSDYEAVVAPIYEWRHAVARDARTGGTLNGMATIAAWQALGGDDGGSAEPAAAVTGRRASRARSLRRRALVASFPIAVAALNRAGLGPLRAEISTAELRRAGLRAMAEVATRLDLGAAHVIFGHTHRAGPFADDDAGEWDAPRAGASERARLTNVGCWTYDPVFLTATPGESPYWPGTAALVCEDGPPELKRLLLDRTHAQLRLKRSTSRPKASLTRPPA